MNTTTMDGIAPKRLTSTPLRSAKRRKTEGHMLASLPEHSPSESDDFSEDIPSSSPLPATRMPSSPPLLPEPKFDDQDMDMDISMSTPKRGKLPISASNMNKITSNAATTGDIDEYMPSSPPLPVRPDANAYDFAMSPRRLNTIGASNITSTITNSTSRTAAGQDEDEATNTLALSQPPPSDAESATDSEIPSPPPPRNLAAPRTRIRVRVRNNFIYIYESQHSRDSSPSAIPRSPSPSNSSAADDNSLASTRDPNSLIEREEPPIPPNSIFAGAPQDDTSNARRFEIFCDNPADGAAYGYEPAGNRYNGRPDDWVREGEMRTTTARMQGEAERLRRAGVGGERGAEGGQTGGRGASLRGASHRSAGQGFGVFEDEGERETGDDQEQEVRERTMQRGEGRFRR